MAELTSIIAALGPVFALVGLGVLLRQLEFPGSGFWPLAERFTYYLLFPLLLVLKISTAELPVSAVVEVMTALLLALLLIALLALALGRLLKQPLAPLSSLFQGSVRFNTYVGLAAASELFGEVGIVWGALFLAMMIPLVNIGCVLVFVLGGRSGSSGWQQLGSSLLKNPLIIACLIGAVLNLSGIGMPTVLTPVLQLLSQMALPLGLLAVGVGLDLRVLRSGGVLLWSSCVLKLLLYPAGFALLAVLLQLPAEAVSVLMVFVALPTAPSAYILARQLGGDAALMAAIITLQTLLAVVTMPLVMGLVSTLLY